MRAGTKHSQRMCLIQRLLGCTIMYMCTGATFCELPQAQYLVCSTSLCFNWFVVDLERQKGRQKRQMRKDGEGDARPRLSIPSKHGITSCGCRVVECLPLKRDCCLCPWRRDRLQAWTTRRLAAHVSELCMPV